MSKRLSQSENKEKVGTILDKKVVRLIKERSFREGRTISEIIQDAIIRYDETGPTKLGLKLDAVERFCSKPFNISRSELDEILEEDYYEV